jgi:hypothetical protein
MADVLLMTGDEDIRVGVQQAQEFGVRVHLLGIEPARENQSGFLVQEADGVRELTRAEVQSFLSRSAQSAAFLGAIPAITPYLPAPALATLEAAAQRIASELNSEEMDAVLKESVGGSVPSQVDRQLLVAGSQAIGGTTLTSEQKRCVRAAFLNTCRKFMK